MSVSVAGNKRVWGMQERVLYTNPPLTFASNKYWLEVLYVALNYL